MQLRNNVLKMGLKDLLEQIAAGESRQLEPPGQLSQIVIPNEAQIRAAVLEELVALRQSLSDEEEQFNAQKAKALAKFLRAESIVDENLDLALEVLGFKQPKEFVFIGSDVPYAKGMDDLRVSIEGLKSEKSPRVSLHPLFKVRGRMVPRPLTTQENVYYMLERWNTYDADTSEEERARLFTESWKDSCDGVANKAKSTKFKIIPECSQLIALPKDFNQPFVSVNYTEDFKGYDELDSSVGKFNCDLTRQEFGENEGWRYLIPDKDIRNEFGDLVFYFLNKFRNKFRNEITVGAGFYARQNTKKDELRAAFVHLLGVGFDANARDDLNNNSSFLRVARAPKNSP